MSKNYNAELELSVISINHGGRADIDNHNEIKNCKSSVEAAMSSSRMTHFFKAGHSDEDLLFLRKKLLLCITMLFTSFSSCRCNLLATFKKFWT